MGAFLIILIVVWLLFIIFRPAITRWTQQFMARRAEDMMRRMMGMPSRKEERRRRQQAGRDSGARSERSRGDEGGYSSRRRHRAPQYDAADLMRSVAEDVEYTEIREFASSTIVDETAGSTRVINEEQVADVEYTEIRGSR